MAVGDNPLVPTRWREHTVSVDGHEIHYTRTGGSGPPLVVAHGVFDDGLCRAPLGRALETKFDVILYDARGHGRSDAPETGYDVASRAAELAGLLDAIEINAPTLYGHSMGGDTVAQFAAAHPDRVEAVVLEDPAAMLTQDTMIPRHMTRYARRQIDRWQSWSIDELLHEDDELVALVDQDRTDLASLLAQARKRVRPAIVEVFECPLVDPVEIFPDVSSPTLVLKADTDEAGREIDHDRASHLPNGQLVHVTGTGHCVVRDRPDAALREIRSFLDQ